MVGVSSPCFLFAGHAAFDAVGRCLPADMVGAWSSASSLAGHAALVLLDDDHLTDMVSAHHSSVSFSLLAMRHPTLSSDVPTDMVGTHSSAHLSC